MRRLPPTPDVRLGAGRFPQGAQAPPRLSRGDGPAGARADHGTHFEGKNGLTKRRVLDAARIEERRPLRVYRALIKDGMIVYDENSSVTLPPPSTPRASPREELHGPRASRTVARPCAPPALST